MPGRRRPGCTNCRKRHLRCDRAAPACSNCRKARPPKQCKFDVLKIRHSVYSAASEEEHEEPPAPQQAEYANISRGAQVHTEAATAMYLTSSAVPTAPYNPILDLHTRTESAPTLPEVHFQGPTSSPIPLNGPESPSYARHHPSDPLELHHGDVNRCSPGSAFGGSPIVYSSPGSTGTSQAPTGHRCVTDPLEQFVFEFYIGQAGPWLDIASSDRHFGETVPRLALAHPVLYAACLAYASNVLCLTGRLARDVYERFHDHAIATLIPLLSPNSDPRADEVLLATAVVLRMSEQFSELSEDGLHHLHGANSLFAMAKDQWSPASVDLRGVAFWTYVRESIRVCFLSEQACPFDLDTVDDEGGWVGHIPEEAWANRLTYLLARLCTACWGNADPVVRAAEREQIRIRLEEWRESVPPSFQPWYNSRDKYRAFPTMKFLSPWHELAWQQYYTAKVMLAVYRSERSDGSTMLALNQFLNAEILHPARLACAVCFGTTNIGCSINGAHLIAWCGQFFNGSEEQRLLAEFLKDFMAKTKWPNRTCYERLEQIWGGTRRTWIGG